mmetsp:Transcript_12269/g.26228  ORF Transcript_12269/g.26228 Transcript_12269/m.26228 type:complete len:208 (+) Transcript_12269:2-625(+)
MCCFTKRDVRRCCRSVASRCSLRRLTPMMMIHNAPRRSRSSTRATRTSARDRRSSMREACPCSSTACLQTLRACVQLRSARSSTLRPPRAAPRRSATAWWRRTTPTTTPTTPCRRTRCSRRCSTIATGSCVRARQVCSSTYRRLGQTTGWHYSRTARSASWPPPSRSSQTPWPPSRSRRRRWPSGCRLISSACCSTRRSTRTAKRRS